ncbi:CPBP family intramembrane glutamic endopeptidase [Methylomonas sp. AM2-LC]|uniref:CPBP family intramembrane glutamic endopeptidase n=1 Tax=Methylomonas sp. AM2-LC TaxID=3153301 RepID=UPI00326764C0
MKKTSLDTNFFKTACLFEGALIVVAIVLGWLTNTDPFANLHFSEAALGLGLLATLPMLIMFFVIQQLPNLAVQKIRDLLLATLGPPLYRRHWTDLFVLSSIAGISEELLFRGVLQPWLENSFNMMTGLVASNLVFALVHAITPIYALLALLIGLYLGVSLDYQGERNLLVPMVIHALYDFVAFIVILRNYKKSLIG